MQTAYRHQAPIMPLMILTAAAGFCKMKFPIIAYLIYLPFLVMFFSYDNDMLKGGAVILAVLAVVFLGYLVVNFRKKAGVPG